MLDKFQRAVFRKSAFSASIMLDTFNLTNELQAQEKNHLFFSLFHFFSPDRFHYQFWVTAK
jgi:hypothetical protein